MQRAILHLHLAYAVTWALHLGFVGYLAARWQRVRKAEEALGPLNPKQR